MVERTVIAARGLMEHESFDCNSKVIAVSSLACFIDFRSASPQSTSRETAYTIRRKEIMISSMGCRAVTLSLKTQSQTDDELPRGVSLPCRVEAREWVESKVSKEGCFFNP
jgi:hypothetical protein